MQKKYKRKKEKIMKKKKIKYSAWNFNLIHGNWILKNRIDIK